MKLFSKFILLIAFLATASTTVTAGYRVQSGRIYDNSTNQEIQLRGVNWFGFQETEDYIVHGLWLRNWRSQIKQMKNIGVNAVRLPFCPAVLENKPSTKPGIINYSLNRELRYKKSLELFDLVVNELNSEQMYILLDHHTPDCDNLTELWYTDAYSEQKWLDDLAFVAERYKNLPYVIGIDLKNEPHGEATWGTGLATDWKLAAEKAATRVLSVAPDMLIFVEGIEDNNQPYVPPCSTGGHWWGGNFEPMDCYPLNIPADRLVLSPHVYGPDVSNHTYFNHPDFPNNMPYWWDLHFGHFAPQYPIVFGEFGGRYGHSSADRVADPRDIPWQNKMVDYMIEKNMRSSFYWSWNPNSGDTGGILQDDWTNVWDDKVALLHRLWNYTPQAPEHGCSDGRDADGDGLLDYPADPGCENAEDDDEFNAPIGSQGLELTTVTNNDWGTGYCREIRVRNTNNFDIDWLINQTIEGEITSIWSGAYTRNGNEVGFGGTWNDILDAGKETTFGFCVTRPAPPPPACADGQDNDQDGLVDLNDPGCATAQDNDEANAPPSSEGLTTDINIVNDWGGGYCADVTVANTTANPIDWTVSFTIEGTVSGLWNVAYVQNGNTVTAEGFSWNNIIQPQGSLAFNFCANR